MVSYNLVWKRSAQKELKSLAVLSFLKFWQSSKPYPAIPILPALKNSWVQRIRIASVWGIIASFILLSRRSIAIDVIHMGHRKEIYLKP